MRRIPCRGGVDGVNIEIISPERAKGVEMQYALEKHSQIPHNKTEQFIYPKSLNSLRPLRHIGILLNFPQKLIHPNPLPPR